MTKWIVFCAVVTALVFGLLIWAETEAKSDCLESGGSWEVVGQTFVSTGKTFVMTDDYGCVGGMS